MQSVSRVALDIFDAKYQVHTESQTGLTTQSEHHDRSEHHAHITEEIIITLRTKFATRTDEWDEQDDFCYSVALDGITAQNAAELVTRLRLRHKWLPSVAEVAAEVAIMKQADGVKQAVILSGIDAEMRRIVRVPSARQIPSSGESISRKRARAAMPWNRRHSNE